MKKYPYAVLIGRFQPFHLGHQALFEHAHSIADHVIIIAGSARVPRTVRNPWNSAEREIFIRGALSAFTENSYTIRHIRDSAYNFSDWLMRVHHEVFLITGDSPTAIVGHFKDDTSFYLNHFPGWSLEALPEQADGISSTEIRNLLFEGRMEGLQKFCAPFVCGRLAEWADSADYKELSDEYNFILEYRKKWETAPYPPVFVTADAAVFALGHVLVIKRKNNPGRGRFALPGGFLEQEESVESAAIRELSEETAIDVDRTQLRASIRMSQVFDHPRRDPRGRLITHAFVFDLSVKELPRVKAGDDAADAFWFPLHKLDDSGEQFFGDHALIIRYFINRMK